MIIVIDLSLKVMCAAFAGGMCATVAYAAMTAAIHRVFMRFASTVRHRVDRRVPVYSYIRIEAADFASKHFGRKRFRKINALSQSPQTLVKHCEALNASDSLPQSKRPRDARPFFFRIAGLDQSQQSSS
jgi:hypothetical protein